MDIQGYISSGIIELYVLGLCGGDERAEVEELSRQHPAIREAIAKYELSLENGLQTYGSIPPSAVDEKMLRRIDELQSPVMQLSRYHQAKKTARWLNVVAAAAVLLLF